MREAFLLGIQSAGKTNTQKILLCSKWNDSGKIRERSFLTQFEYLVTAVFDIFNV
jgi:hypothetical protein